MPAEAIGGSALPFTGLQNVTGQPAINVPMSFSANGLPVGVQLAGRFGADDVVLQLARQIEIARPWAHYRPPVWG